MGSEQSVPGPGDASEGLRGSGGRGSRQWVQGEQTVGGVGWTGRDKPGLMGPVDLGNQWTS